MGDAYAPRFVCSSSGLEPQGRAARRPRSYMLVFARCSGLSFWPGARIGPLWGPEGRCGAGSGGLGFAGRRQAAWCLAGSHAFGRSVPPEVVVLERRSCVEQRSKFERWAARSWRGVAPPSSTMSSAMNCSLFCVCAGHVSRHSLCACLRVARACQACAARNRRLHRRSPRRVCVRPR